MIIAGGIGFELPGLQTRSWFEGSGLHLSPDDRRPRSGPRSWVRSLILHTTVGDEPQIVVPGIGAPGLAPRVIRNWGNDPKHAGAHLVIDQDGTIFCVADLLLDATFHARAINEVSIGIELAQTKQLEIRTVQLEVLIKLCDRLTELEAPPSCPIKIAIQRQFYRPYRGSSHPVGRLAAGGQDCVGVFGHRDQSDERSAGDPGDAVFRWLNVAGYEAFDGEQYEDVRVWSGRQAALGLKADGVPGPMTRAGLQRAGHAHGLWVPRP